MSNWQMFKKTIKAMLVFFIKPPDVPNIDFRIYQTIKEIIEDKDTNINDLVMFIDVHDTLMKFYVKQKKLCKSLAFIGVLVGILVISIALMSNSYIYAILNVTMGLFNIRLGWYNYKMYKYYIMECDLHKNCITILTEGKKNMLEKEGKV